MFGPFQIITSFEDGEIDKVCNIISRFDNHLTAGIVSKDQQFSNYVLGHTNNGVTYAGIRARTTGAPQNHWFGPSGSPKGAGIGTREAIRHTWTSHRETVMDIGPIPKDWNPPPCT